jgi:tetratricopeptide (TPR) repeat protein
MNPSEGKPIPSVNTFEPERRWSGRDGAVLAVAFGLALTILFIGYLGYRRTIPQPPPVALDDADPEVAAAVREAQATVQRRPRMADAWGRLGMVLAVHDYWSEALTCLAHAERLNPREPRWPYYRALALVPTEPDAALPFFRRAVECCGDRPDAPRLRLADSLLALGQDNEAEEQYRLLLQQDAGHPRAHLGLARLAYAGNDLQSSLDHLRSCADSPYTQRAAYLLRAEIHQRMGNGNAATADLGRAVRLPPDTDWPDPFAGEAQQLKTGVQGTIDRAAALIERGQAREAAQLLEGKTRQQADAPWSLWLWFGRAEIGIGDYSAAEAALRQAVKLAPEAAEAQFFLGGVLFKEGHPQEAAACFRQATQVKPDYMLAYYNLGQCLRLQGDRGGAIAAFREAVRCKPSFADAQSDLAELLAEDGKESDALLHMQQALELNPEDAKAKQLRARLQRSGEQGH